MIEFLLYMLVTTSDGEVHVLMAEDYTSSVICQAQRAKLDGMLEMLDTSHLESVRTGCHERELEKVKI